MITGGDKPVNPVRLVSDTRTWTDSSRDLVPQLDELGPSTGFNLGTTNRFADGLKWPYSVEYSIGVQRSLPCEMVAGITYINRQRRSGIGSRNLAVPTDTYIPKTVPEVNSGPTVTVYDQAPSLRGQFDVLYGNSPEMDTEFNGVDITLNKRLSHRWMMMGSASFGESRGDIYGSTFDLNDPNNSFRRGLIQGPLEPKNPGALEVKGFVVDVQPDDLGVWQVDDRLTRRGEAERPLAVRDGPGLVEPVDERAVPVRCAPSSNAPRSPRYRWRG